MQTRLIVSPPHALAVGSHPPLALWPVGTKIVLLFFAFSCCGHHRFEPHPHLSAQKVGNAPISVTPLRVRRYCLMTHPVHWNGGLLLLSWVCSHTSRLKPIPTPPLLAKCSVSCYALIGGRPCWDYRGRGGQGHKLTWTLSRCLYIKKMAVSCPHVSLINQCIQMLLIDLIYEVIIFYFAGVLF